MRKARITRRTVRLVLAYGRREYDGMRAREVYWCSTLAIENVTYQVSWVQKAGYVLVVSAWRKGEYD
jgi:hypothetical protein